MKLKRLGVLLLSCVVLISLLFGGTAWAQEEESSLPDLGITPPGEEEEPSLPDAGITPISSFYFFERIFETIQEFLTLNPEAKARLNVAFAAERVAEIQVMLQAEGVEAEGLDVA